MKKQILITGKVHDIDYRVFLLGLAETLELDRFYADNIFIDNKEGVKILVDGSEDKVNRFIDTIKREKPQDAVVDEIDVKDYDGSIMNIEAYSRYFTSIQLAKLVGYGRDMNKKMDKMLAKQDETIKVIREESEKTRVELGNKIDLLHTDLKSYIESNIKSIRDEISEIKQVLKNAGLI